MKRLIERIVGWISVIVGLLILGSCTFGGAMMGFQQQGLLGGLGLGIGGFVLAVIVNAVVFGGVFSYLLIKDDLSAIRSQLERLDRDAAARAAKPDAAEETRPGA